MNEEALTTAIAEQVMGWKSAPDRFLMGNRGWLPRWRFQPTERLVHAFRLLDAAAPEFYSINGGTKQPFTVRIQIGALTGEAHGPSKPKVITCAIAMACGIDVEANG